MGQLWVACEGTMFCLDQTSWTFKVREENLQQEESGRFGPNWLVNNNEGLELREWSSNLQEVCINDAVKSSKFCYFCIMSTVCCYWLQAVCTLPSGQLIESVHLTGVNTVWVSVQRSPLLHLLHAPSGSLLCTVDCKPPVLHTLRCKPCSGITIRPCNESSIACPNLVAWNLLCLLKDLWQCGVLLKACPSALLCFCNCGA